MNVELVNGVRGLGYIWLS